MNSPRLAVTSLVASLLTITFFCIGFLPIPLTAIPCYPAALIAGLVALVSGARAILAGRASGQPAGWMAWLGVATGVFVILAVACFTSLTLMALPVLAETLQQVWPSLGG